ncbi:MAG: MBL fold metallo-hydrolase [Ancrocorticia sp.]
MIFLRYSETLIEANCYILSDETARKALVVDPGAGSAAWVRRTLEDRELELAAVLCTHGHADHVWDAGVVAGDDVVVYLPEPDLYRLENPAIYTAVFTQFFVSYSGHEWMAPARSEALPQEFYKEGGAEIVPGIRIRAIPAPGHSEGSSVFLLEGQITQDPEAVRLPEGSFGTELMLTGDVLFRDGVGRTDLPGSDPAAAQISLRNLAQTIAPARVFFPGHGGPSTMGRELRHSPYLREAVNSQ